MTKAIKTANNMDGMDKLIDSLKMDFTGLSFLNLVDFDAVYGHRRNPEGYGRALEEFDGRLPEVIDSLGDDDLLIITADHGNDPTHHGTDHTREYVPLLVYSKRMEKGVSLGLRETFADVGATIAELPGKDASIWYEFLSRIIQCVSFCGRFPFSSKKACSYFY